MSQTTNQTTATTALAAVGKKPLGKRGGKRIEEHFFTELYKRDISDILFKGVDNLRFNAPDVVFTVTVQFHCTQKEFDYLKSEGVSPYVQQLAQGHVDDVLTKVNADLKIINMEVAKRTMSADEAEPMLRERLDDLQGKACKLIAMDLERSAAIFTKNKREIKVSKIRAIASVATDTISIIGHVGHAAASWGGTSPIAIVLIARSIISIVQTVGIAIAKADKIAMVIDGYFVVLDKLLSDMNSSDLPELIKLRNDGAEVTMAAVSAVLGIKTPSIKNCKEMIKEYRVKITEFEVKMQRLGPQLTEMIEHNERLAAQVEALPETNDKEEGIKSTLRQFFAKEADDNFKDLFKRVAELNEQIVKGYSQADDYSERIKLYADSTHTITQWAGTVFSLGINSALGASFPEEAIVRGLEGLCALMEEANKTIIEHFK